MLIKRLILAISLVVTMTSQAQDSLLLHDYEYVKQADPWLTSTNAAALTRFSENKLAQADIAINYAKGGLTNYYDAPKALSQKGRIESFYRYSPRTVFFGSISYEHFSGDDMAGSAFINPERMPFDIVEDSLTNEGKKDRDTYRLSGGFGTRIYHDIALGLKFNYTAANYAKYKDLRHQNKLMDLQLSAGAYLPLSTWCCMGANYLYQRNTESIRFGTYGTGDKVYNSLISYANFTGALEQFGMEGFTDKSKEIPLVTDKNGVSLQLSSFHSSLSTFLSYTYIHGFGYYGRKSPFTITYSGHHNDQHQWKARITHHLSPTSHHYLDLSLDIEQMQNEANNYRQLRNVSSATFYEYYTPNKTADKLWHNYSIAYTLHLDVNDALPTWTLQAGINGMERKQTAYIYPYYRRQKIHNEEAFVSVCRNILTQKGVWSLSVNGSFLKGGGTPYEDLTFQEPSDKQTVPPSMDAYLYREYQWLTAAQFCVGGQAKYTFIWPNTRIKTFARMSLSHRKANESFEYSNGQNRTQATLAIGCEF